MLRAPIDMGSTIYSDNDGRFRDSNNSILSSDPKNKKLIEVNPNTAAKAKTHSQIQLQGVVSRVGTKLPITTATAIQMRRLTRQPRRRAAGTPAEIDRLSLATTTCLPLVANLGSLRTYPGIPRMPKRDILFSISRCVY